MQPSAAQRFGRREWIVQCLIAPGLALMAVPAAPLAAQARRIETVIGPINPAWLGLTLMHEHVLVDFIGATEVSASRYDAAPDMASAACASSAAVISPGAADSPADGV